MRTGDDAGAPAELSRALATIAARAGVTLDDATATRLTPILASVLNDWKMLTRGALPDIEPMSIGPCPEDHRGGT